MSKARDVSRLFSKTGSSSSDVGSSTVSSDTPPVGAGAGDKWFNTTNLTTYIYYDDGTSLQWVPSSAPIPGPTGATGPAPSIDFSAINQAMIPDTDVTHDLGSSTHKWKDLYLSGSTLYLGASATISAGTGSEIVLPSIKIGAGANAVKLSANASGGLETQAVVGGTTQAVKPAGGTVQVADLAAMQAIANPTIGDFVSVVSNKTIYMYNGTGFYKIAVMVNESPTAITGVDGSYQLAIDGTATTITAISSDPEGRPLTWSYAVSSGALNGTTVAQTNNVFTITPHASNVAAFSLTFSVTDGINGAVNAVSTFGLSFSVTNSRYTSLLLKATTTGLQTFDDASTSNHTITAGGNVTASTFSPHRHGGYSAYINNKADAEWSYLRLPDDTLDNIVNDSTASAIATHTTTIEAWVYPLSRRDNFASTNGSGSCIFVKGYTWFNLGIDVDGYVQCYHISGGSALQSGAGYTENNIITSNTVPLNAWSHVAAVIDNSQIKVYVNGVLGATGTWGGLHDVTASASRQSSIGAGAISNQAPRRFYGYIRNFRISDNSRYASNFTPSTELPSVDSDTDFLLGGLPYLKDQSASNHAITVNGNASLKPKSLFDNAAYSEADHGASAYFDGSGDYLTGPTPATIGIGTGDFTIECWFYATDATTDKGVWDTHTNASNSDGLTLTRITATTFRVWQSSQILVSSATAITDHWNHLAVVRNSGLLELFVNGVSQGTVSNSANLNSAQGILIGGGRYSGTTSPTQFVKGYIQDFRVTTSAVYTSAFTPPTAPLTAITNTKFLLNPEPAIIDLAQKSHLMHYGGTGPEGSTTQVAIAGTKSIMHTDFSTAYGVYIKGYSPEFRLNSTFTLEFWAYLSMLTQDTHFYETYGGTNNSFDNATGTETRIGIIGSKATHRNNFGSNAIGNYFKQNTDYSNIVYQAANYGITLANAQWHHWAITQDDSGNCKWYLDGTQIWSYTISLPIAITNTSNYRMRSTAWGNNSSPGPAYIQDYRLTRGLIRYTSNFTPPTAELQG